MTRYTPAAVDNALSLIEEQCIDDIRDAMDTDDDATPAAVSASYRRATRALLAAMIKSLDTR